MSLSDRLSGRVVERSGNDLVNRGDTAIRGADGSLAAAPILRGGRHQLGQLRASLSGRDLAVLRSVGAFHFVTTKQLEWLHFHGLHATPLAAARAARRSVRRLHDLRLLDHLDRRIGGVRAGSASFVWLLASRGYRLLGDDKRRRSREPSLVHLQHVLDVAELVVQLHERSRTEDVELLNVETEPTCWRTFVSSHGGQSLLKPDLRLTIGVDEHELHWFVELDRATEYGPALKRKLTTYVMAWRDGGEQARAGVFPRVLWVVPDQDRAEAIAAVWQAMDTVPEGMFQAITTDQAVDVLTTVGGQP